MGVISKPNTFSPNTTMSSSQVNSNFDTIYNEFNGNIAAANLATGAVTTAKIADSNVTTAKIADSNVTTAKINDDAVNGQKLDSASIIQVSSTPAGNSESSAGVWSNWSDDVNINVPSWANRALVVATVEGYYMVTATTYGRARVVIGSDNGAPSGRIGQITTVSANESQGYTWTDTITLTGTGTKVLKTQVFEDAGGGAMRVGTISRFSWFIVFLAV